ncbi:spore germination protein [Halobacillus seohaensis]|uniref:Spore germination protein n=1 Tax=Halobacillus seohaensis TaxID=447421 RepID=A0ABW2EMU0_9BACI
MSCIIVGKLKFNSISGGVINFGDSLYIAPKSVEKAISGSGGGGVGDFQIVSTGMSITNGVDPDITDQNLIANN